MTKSKIRLMLYIIAMMIIMVPTAIVLPTDITFNSATRKILISTSFTCIIIGKILKVSEKEKTNKNIQKDIIVIITLLILILAKILD